MKTLEGHSNWLIIERLENWKVDASKKFSYFGISERKKKIAEQICAGDKLFVYVIGEGCFSDIRRATRSGIRRLRMGGDYPDSYPWCIDTAPLLTLPPEKWLPAQSVKDRLQFLKDLRDWRQSFRTAPRALNKKDANTLEAALEKRAQ